MSLSSTTVWEVRTAGSDNNGGGYVTGGGGTDRSQQDSAQGNGTNLTVDASTNTDVTPDGFSVGSADVGNLIQITTTGTGAAFTTGFYEIKSIQGGTKWRLDRSPAATSSAGATWAMGGGLATPGKASGAIVASNVIWIRGGGDPESNPYSISASSNVAGGRMTISVNGVHVKGYLTTRGDITTIGGLRPVLKAAANSVDIITESGNSFYSNLILDGDKANRTTTRGFGGTNGHQCFNILVRNCNGNGFNNSGANCSYCEAADNAGRGFSVTEASNCVAHGNTDGFNDNNAGSGSYVHCLSYSNSSTGFNTTTRSRVFDHCTAALNGGSGFGVQGIGSVLTNVLSYGNTLYGISATTVAMVRNAALGSNGSGATNGTMDISGTITLTADPFKNSAGGDYSPNPASGGGGLIRDNGIGWLGSGTTTRGSVGAVEPPPNAVRLINAGLVH